METFFCATASCPVVYFGRSPDSRFTRDDLTVRVGIKETEDPIPVCYCFDHTRASVREELDRTGTSTVVERIRAGIQAGNCRCESKNPSGHCCLGEVTRVVKLETEAAAAGRDAPVTRGV